MTDKLPRDGQPIRVLLVDDHRAFTEALQVVLNLQPDLRVVGTAATAELATGEARRTQPDVVLMDYHLPDQNGADTAAQVKRVSPASKVVMLTSAAADDVLVACIEAGVSGYLSKEQAVDDVAETVRKAYAGDILVPRSTLLRLLSKINERSRATRSVGAVAQRLTSREYDVLQEVATGGDDGTISSRLGISPLTFRTHVRNIMGKLGVHSRLEAVTFAVRNGLIRL